MKKRKFNFIIDIAVLCLCVAAIAIGVYSAKQATLNVSGTIGFNAHDCEVAVSGVMNAYTQNANGTNDAVVKYFNKTEAEGGEANIVKGSGSTNTWDIGSVCFDDLNVDKYHYVNDISFTFNITNNSAFYVDVTVDQKCINNDRIFIYAPNNGETLAPKGQDGSSVTLIVKIQLEKDANGEYSALPSALDLTQASPLLNFQKSQAPAYLSTNWRSLIMQEFRGITDSTQATSAYRETTKVSFLREIDDTLLTSYDKNEDGTYKTVSVGAVNETSKAGNLTESVSDVTAYYNSTNKEIIIYSPARIYAPQSCQTLFFGCTKLTNINFANFDTSKTKNMGGMFSGTTGKDSSGNTVYYYLNMETIDVSNFDTSNVDGFGGAFTQMFANSNIKSLDLRNFNTAKATNMLVMFSSCVNLQNLELRNFDTSSVESMSGMFQNCSSLKSLQLISFNTTKVTNMSHMFFRCSSLTELDVSSFNTSNVTSMKGMFAATTGTSEVDVMKLKKLDLSHFDVSKVTDFTAMFYRCEYLEELNITGWKTTSATTFDNLFNRCSSLKSVDVSGFDTTNVTDMNEMFSDCYELESLDLRHFDTSKVIKMEGMFSADYGSSSDNKVMKLKTLDLSSFDTSLVTNMKAMFNRCSNLTTIYVGAKWNTSAVTDSAEMFAECTVLVGANGTSYANMLTTDADNANLVKYAVVDTESTPGYLTHI